MPCKSCGGSKKSITIPLGQRIVQQPVGMSDVDMVLVTYENPNRGQHKVVGASTKINYGYRQGGGVERFYVHRADIASYPEFFIPFTPPSVNVEQPKVEPPLPPVSLIEPAVVETIIETHIDFIETKPASAEVGVGDTTFRPLDLESIPGVTESIAEQLHTKNIRTWDDIIELGLEGLKTIEGIGDKRAEAILAFARKKTE